jgi:hypothetical protein
VYDYTKRRSKFRKRAKENDIQAVLHPGALGGGNVVHEAHGSADGSFHLCERVVRDLRPPIVAVDLYGVDVAVVAHHVYNAVTLFLSYFFARLDDLHHDTPPGIDIPYQS